MTPANVSNKGSWFLVPVTRVGLSFVHSNIASEHTKLPIRAAVVDACSAAGDECVILAHNWLYCRLHPVAGAANASLAAYLQLLLQSAKVLAVAPGLSRSL